MADDTAVRAHYGRDGLYDTIVAALAAAGKDVARLSPRDLAPIDHFHGRGVEATAEMADLLPVAPGDHLLDIGSGIGGPARYMADRFGCRITGIDLTETFCDVARRLTALVGWATFQCDALPVISASHLANAPLSTSFGNWSRMAD